MTQVSDHHFILATAERAVKLMVEMDSFHLSRMTHQAAIDRTVKRIQAEMIDATYTSPHRADELGNECRVLCQAIVGMAGPKILLMLQNLVDVYLPKRAN